MLNYKEEKYKILRGPFILADPINQAVFCLWQQQLTKTNSKRKETEDCSVRSLSFTFILSKRVPFL